MDAAPLMLALALGPNWAIVDLPYPEVGGPDTPAVPAEVAAPLAAYNRTGDPGYLMAAAISLASFSSARLCAAASPAGSREGAGSVTLERPVRGEPLAGVTVQSASTAAPSSRDESNRCTSTATRKSAG